MSVYKVTRSDEYLMHKKGGGYSDGSGKTKALFKKQSDVDGDGKLEWTEYGKAWRREQYKLMKEQGDQARTGITNIGNEVEGIATGKAYDRRRAELKSQASKMSDEELRAITNRLNLERGYADAIMNDEARRGKVTFGKVMGIVGAATVTLGAAAGAAASVVTIVNAVKKNKGQ